MGGVERWSGTTVPKDHEVITIPTEELTCWANIAPADAAQPQWKEAVTTAWTKTAVQVRWVGPSGSHVVSWYPPARIRRRQL
ncbi:hypothetical protein Kisp01_67850 [Kineosporia sp. NBRC 101677]|uniref:hypothetical protein n=1 Tax=Kineosporia sp. NBRC 101677 TaxID=3032197 RepID=UPI0024A304D1|nr:hypothetical protein [Kineosporia sp. NBRC 101677]GLY19771.1 hypothetical protein Kisp01_67850 [Kineosporia sp. NBRC 101677]